MRSRSRSGSRFRSPGRGSTCQPAPSLTSSTSGTEMRKRSNSSSSGPTLPPSILLCEQVYELKVLELGGEGGGELGAVPLLAYRVGDLEEGGNRARRCHVAPFQGDDGTGHLRVLLDGDDD